MANDYSDLVKRLRGPIKHPQQSVTMRLEAADAIEALMAENMRLRRKHDEMIVAESHFTIESE